MDWSRNDKESGRETVSAATSAAEAEAGDSVSTSCCSCCSCGGGGGGRRLRSLLLVKSCGEDDGDGSCSVVGVFPVIVSSILLFLVVIVATVGVVSDVAMI